MRRRAGTRPRRLTVPAFAKVNLGLEVLGLREDGYHELRTIFQSIDLADRIRIEERPEGLEVRCDHPGVPAGEENLAYRAAASLQRHAGIGIGASIGIAKRIPVAGGLGGGSSNAAAVLRGLDALWRLGLGVPGLLPLARRLGADVPYFLFGGAALGTARGDEVYPLALPVRAHVVVVDAGIPVSTPAVFRRLDARLTPRENSNTIFRFISGYLEQGAGAFPVLSNDLEVAALEEAPELARRAGRIRSALRGAGARLVALTGSGSSYFGVFDGAAQAVAALETLQARGFQGHRCRTLSGERYRTLWKRALDRAGGSSEERTSWRSQTSRSSRSTTRS